MPIPSDFVYLLGDVDGNGVVDANDIAALSNVPSGGPLPIGLSLYQVTLGTAFSANDLTYLQNVAGGTDTPLWIMRAKTGQPPLSAPDRVFSQIGSDFRFLVYATEPCSLLFRARNAQGILTRIDRSQPSTVSSAPFIGMTPQEYKDGFGAEQGIGYYTPTATSNVHVTFNLPSAGFYVFTFANYDPRGKLAWQVLPPGDLNLVADMQPGEFTQKVLRNGAHTFALPGPAEYRMAITPFFVGLNEASLGGISVPAGNQILATDGQFVVPKGDSRVSTAVPFVAPFQIVGTLPPTGSQTAGVYPPPDEGSDRNVILTDDFVTVAKTFRPYITQESFVISTEPEKEEFHEMFRVQTAVAPVLSDFNRVSRRQDKLHIVVYRAAASNLLAYIDLADLATKVPTLYVNAAKTEDVDESNLKGNLAPAILAASLLWSWFPKQTATAPVEPITFIKAVATVLAEELDYGTPTLAAVESDYGGVALIHPWLRHHTEQVSQVADLCEAYYAFCQLIYSDGIPPGYLTVPTLQTALTSLAASLVNDAVIAMQALATKWGHPVPAPTDTSVAGLRTYLVQQIATLQPQIEAEVVSKIDALDATMRRGGGSVMYSLFNESVDIASLPGLYLNTELMKAVLSKYDFHRLLLAWEEADPIDAVRSLCGINLLPILYEMQADILEELPLERHPQLVANYRTFRQRLLQATSVLVDSISNTILSWPNPETVDDVPSAMLDVTTRTVALGNVVPPLENTTTVVAQAGCLWLAKASALENGVALTFTTDKDVAVSIYRKV